MDIFTCAGFRKPDISRCYKWVCTRHSFTFLHMPQKLLSYIAKLYVGTLNMDMCVRNMFSDSFSYFENVFWIKEPYALIKSNFLRK
jgi:hypothetical protein